MGEDLGDMSTAKRSRDVYDDEDAFYDDDDYDYDDDDDGYDEEVPPPPAKKPKREGVLSRIWNHGGKQTLALAGAAAVGYNLHRAGRYLDDRFGTHRPAPEDLLADFPLLALAGRRRHSVPVRPTQVGGPPLPPRRSSLGTPAAGPRSPLEATPPKSKPPHRAPSPRTRSFGTQVDMVGPEEPRTGGPANHRNPLPSERPWPAHLRFQRGLRNLATQTPPPPSREQAVQADLPPETSPRPTPRSRRFPPPLIVGSEAPLRHGRRDRNVQVPPTGLARNAGWTVHPRARPFPQ